ncbi:MAG TPA: diaminopimelate epimerase [Methanomicrobia archaeon]|nr:diaminopimelate epimerase [Methanomicrobia archaeon]
MRRIRFTKLQGSGNDFILIDDRLERSSDAAKAACARALCRRKFSVGADGVLFICLPTSDAFDLRMRIFNPDGSEAEMCGNGMRCFAKYVFEHGIIHSKRIQVETLAGLIVPEVELDDTGLVRSIRVFMGRPVFEKLDEPFFVNADIGSLRVTALSLGNPHAVVIVDSFEGLDVHTVGKAIESHPAFLPQKTNVDFVVRREGSTHELTVRTYERGVGETLACGTGSTASVLTLYQLGLVNKNEPVTVHTRGGDLVVEVREDGAYLQGPAEEVYEGVVDLAYLSRTRPA